MLGEYADTDVDGNISYDSMLGECADTDGDGNR